MPTALDNGIRSLGALLAAGSAEASGEPWRAWARAEGITRGSPALAPQGGGGATPGDDRAPSLSFLMPGCGSRPRLEERAPNVLLSARTSG
jgi:hypothetical protein